MVMRNEEKNRNNDKRTSHGNRNNMNNTGDIDVDPLADYVSYILPQGKLPRRVRIFIFLYGIYYRVMRLVRKE